MNQNPTPKSPQPNEMLEFYKFHAEFYERANQQKNGINRTYLGLLMAIAAFVGLSVRFPLTGISLWDVFLVAGVLMSLLSASWLLQLRVHIKSIAAKLAVLKELEEKMSFDFFSREERARAALPQRKHLFKFVFAEEVLPQIFVWFSFMLMMGGFLGGFAWKMSGGN